MPRKIADDGPKDAGLSIRTTRGFRDKLTLAAKQSGRSLAQEVERRLEQSFEERPDAAPQFFGDNETAYLAKNKHAAEMVSALAVVVASIDTLAKRRGFSEIEHREALQAALDVVKHAYLWAGEDAPADVSLEVPVGTRRADYPPRPLGRAVAADRINYNSAWHDELIPGDTFEGRILDHWSGSGSMIVAGPSHSEVEAERAAVLKEAHAARARGEVSLSSDDEPGQTPLKDIFGGR